MPLVYDHRARDWRMTNNPRPAMPADPEMTRYVDKALVEAGHFPLAPSSPDARAHGCTCLGGDTTDGNGLDSAGHDATDDRRQHWVVAADCPVHARNLPSGDVHPGATPPSSTEHDQ